jgi:GntR family transcriptional repressor for pyruvate dehydrogenase complex
MNDVVTHRIRQPRVAEIVASQLRDDILSGRLKEGDVLPPQEGLLGEFGVSPPALRADAPGAHLRRDVRRP